LVTFRILIAGVGNRLMGDDGFGPRVVELLSSRSLPENVDLKDLGTSGITAAMEIEGYDLVIFLDSMKMEGDPGTIRQVEIDVHDMTEQDVLGLTEISLHEAGLEELIKFSKAIGSLPPRIILIGCKPKIICLGIELSAEVEQASHEAEKRVLEIIRQVSK